MWRVIVVVGLIAGCARGPLPARSDIEPTPPPSAGQTAVAALRVSPHRLTQGEVLYIRHCAGCHGWEGRGHGALGQVLVVQPPPLQRAELFAHNTEAELVARILLGKDLQVPITPASLPDSEAEVTALVTYLQRLPAIPWDQVEEGAHVYDSVCVSCHGIYGAGDGLLAAALPAPPQDLSASLFQSPASDEALARVIAEGKGAMPGAADVLSSDELRAVVAFVRLLSPGYELYDRFCAACHGPDGNPPGINSQDIFGAETVLAGIPTFDEEYFQTRSEDHLRLWVRHMLKENRVVMPHFSGGLNAEEVRQILAYLRSLLPAS